MMDHVYGSRGYLFAQAPLLKAIEDTPADRPAIFVLVGGERESLYFGVEIINAGKLDITLHLVKLPELAQYAILRDHGLRLQRWRGAEPNRLKAGSVDFCWLARPQPEEIDYWLSRMRPGGTIGGGNYEDGDVRSSVYESFGMPDELETLQDAGLMYWRIKAPVPASAGVADRPDPSPTSP